MRIRFELTPDDLAAYSLHYAKHSPEWRRQMRLQVYGVALAIGLSTYLEAGGYAFINLNGLQAHIIPMGRLVEGDGEAFLHDLKARLGKAV